MNRQATLICYDTLGNIVADLSFNTTRILGEFETGTENGSRIIELKEDKARIWFSVDTLETQNMSMNKKTVFAFPQIKISGNTITWEFHVADVDSDAHVYLGLNYQKIGANIIYGVFYE